MLQRTIDRQELLEFLEGRVSAQRPRLTIGKSMLGSTRLRKYFTQTHAVELLPPPFLVIEGLPTDHCKKAQSLNRSQFLFQGGEAFLA
jgi:hypothetical protein